MRPLIVRLCFTLLVTAACATLWTLLALHHFGTDTRPFARLGALGLTLLLPLLVLWQVRGYRLHTRHILFLLDALENEDPTIRYATLPKLPPDTRLINEALNRVVRLLDRTRHDTAQREKYYQLILECAGSGIVVLNKQGFVYQKNSEALRLLGIEVFTHLDQLNRLSPTLAEQFRHCRAGDQWQTRLDYECGSRVLSVRVSAISVKEEPLRILSLSDIHNELDEHEIDSWMKLTRVLTHEIMNSVTPITSLSDTLLQRVGTGQLPPDEMQEGLQTIRTTSKALLDFVESYRRFTHLPTPTPHVFAVAPFLQQMAGLARHQSPDALFCIEVTTEPDDLLLYADENLLSQVLTNLLKNAVQALESRPAGSPSGLIRLRAYTDASEAVFIEVSNNGPAIPADVADHIFIPFFTTKEEGCGIGLSISRQIMRLNGGQLHLLPGLPVTFRLVFA